MSLPPEAALTVFGEPSLSVRAVSDPLAPIPGNFL